MYDTSATPKPHEKGRDEVVIRPDGRLTNVECPITLAVAGIYDRIMGNTSLCRYVWLAAQQLSDAISRRTVLLTHAKAAHNLDAINEERDGENR